MLYKRIRPRWEWALLAFSIEDNCELISWLIAKIPNESRMFVTLYELSAVTQFRFFRKDVVRLCVCYIKAAKQQQLNKWSLESSTISAKILSSCSELLATTGPAIMKIIVITRLDRLGLVPAIERDMKLFFLPWGWKKPSNLLLIWGRIWCRMNANRWRPYPLCYNVVSIATARGDDTHQALLYCVVSFSTAAIVTT